MPASIPKTRLRKAFNEGRRSAAVESEQNPYDNPKLRQLWDLGRTQQRAGEITTAIPPLEHGETRGRPGGAQPAGVQGRPQAAPQAPAAVGLRQPPAPAVIGDPKWVALARPFRETPRVVRHDLLREPRP